MPVITPEAYVRSPYEFFAKQRSIHPLVRIDFFQGPVWLVTGYEEAEAMMKDARFIRDGRSVADTDPHAEASDKVGQAMEMKNRMILVRDAPFHTRVRGLVGKAFTPAAIHKLQPAVEAVAGQLLLEMRGRRHHDLIADFAYRFPMYVISDLIGVPKEDRHYSRHWSEAFVQFIDFHTTADDLDAASGGMLEARRYFKELIDRKRRKPGTDLISQWTALQAQGGEISDDELIATCVLLLSAGHETTVNLIANGYYLLLKHPDQCGKLRRDPALLSNAVEEILRYEPPALTTSRWVAEDMEFRGQSLRRGEFVIIALGGAGRDPRANPDPDRFDIARTPVKHLSFASGAHYCLGAPLARLEGRIAIGMLVKHLERPALLEEPVWKNSIALRGFHSLRIEAEVNLHNV